ncbi:hypothetical protein N7645_15005 [Pseudomonas juntendi]|uniref:hypothetical protein n=1 Tax=Pseudomonas TaxID=286 RepID=UPI0012ADC432|nr:MULTISPECIES: hypothetical protein [Pseudomonas]MDG9918196.1 hypothetical protein [Pseudomonas juntendi]MDH0507644.1 hypothetical protein [Pseudomonas juntendi]MDH1044874.1 hypothetical protein [Pseudomonas juntendi]MRT62313.1 hypothetical protein [Pseudomonas sp. CAH-1]
MNTQTIVDTRHLGKKGPGRPALPADQKSKKESVYLRPDVRRELEDKFPGLPVSQQVNLYILGERQKAAKIDAETDVE